MKKIITLTLFFCFCQFLSNAQNETVNSAKVDNFIGVQVNGLIRQIFTTTNTTGNPYLFNYSINSKQSGWGFRIGAGYGNSNSSNNSGNGESSSENTNLQLRAGIEKIYKLSKKWTSGAGLDFVYNYYSSTSNSISYGTSGNNDTTINSSKSAQNTFGGGPMAWLRYNITDKIILGTETSFYFVKGTKYQTVEYEFRVTDPTSPTGYSYVPRITDSKNIVSNGNYNSPMVFFLIVKF